MHIHQHGLINQQLGVCVGDRVEHFVGVAGLRDGGAGVLQGVQDKTAKPCLFTTSSSFSAMPRGRFVPASHF